MTTDPLLWDVKRTAAELGLSTRYLYKLISDKEIEFVRIGRTSTSTLPSSC